MPEGMLPSIAPPPPSGRGCERGCYNSYVKCGMAAAAISGLRGNFTFEMFSEEKRPAKFISTNHMQRVRNIPFQPIIRARTLIGARLWAWGDRGHSNQVSSVTMAKSLRSKIKRKFRTELRKRIGVPHEAVRDAKIQENLKKTIESQGAIAL